MFGRSPVVELDLEPFGPTTLWLPDPSAMRKRIVKQQYERTIQQIGGPSSAAAKAYLQQMWGFVEAHLPEPQSIGIQAWPHRQMQALIVMGTTIGLQNQPPGPRLVHYGVHLAALHLLMDTFDDSPRIDALLGWLGRIFYVCAALRLSSEDAGRFVQGCLRNIGSLSEF